jgi:hypothetical protein
MTSAARIAAHEFARAARYRPDPSEPGRIKQPSGVGDDFGEFKEEYQAIIIENQVAEKNGEAIRDSYNDFCRKLHYKWRDGQRTG